MKPLHKHLSWAFVLLLTLLAACSPSAPATPTPTPSGGGGETSASGSSDASGPAADPGASVDAATGLGAPVLGAAPAGAAPPASRPSGALPSDPSAENSATIAISGGLPLMVTGGSCSTLDGETYVSVPAVFDAPPPYASLVIYPASDESNLRGGYLVWASSDAATDSALVSTQDLFVITLNDDLFSGSFAGTAHKVVEGVPVQEVIDVNGVFNCIAGLLRVFGDHPVDMTGAQCETVPQIVISSGRSGENAALLVVEPGATPDTAVRGGLSWRVGGSEYTTNWLSVTVNADQLSGSYYGEGRRPDGSTFPVQGAFNCLGM